MSRTSTTPAMDAITAFLTARPASIPEIIDATGYARSTVESALALMRRDRSPIVARVSRARPQMQGDRRFKVTLRERLEAFFAENPGEELTYADVAAKFDVTRACVKQAVYRLKLDQRLTVATVIRSASPSRACLEAA